MVQLVDTRAPFEYADSVKGYVGQIATGKIEANVDDLKVRLLRVSTRGLPYYALRECIADEIARAANCMTVADKQTIMHIYFLLDEFEKTA